MSYEAGAPSPADAEDERRAGQLVLGRHGQSPKSIEKKKLRLGGYGATSMFRTMAWLVEVAHLGIEPRDSPVNRSRLRPVSESRAVWTARPKRLLYHPVGQVVASG